MIIREIVYEVTETDFGKILIAECLHTHFVVAVHFIDNDLDERIEEVREAYSTATLSKGEATQAPDVVRAINNLDTTVPIKSRQRAETDFQVQVFAAIRQIPKGETRTYGQIALQIGKAGAAQAVGRALSCNNLAYIIPCHRVITNGGPVGGYRWGMEKKQELLNAEGFIPTFRGM